jgi:hypothetical protein
MTFERKIMRKIYGPTRTDDGYWRIKTNQEINDLLKGQNIIGFIKKQRLSWLGHVERMTEDSIAQKIKRWKPNHKYKCIFGIYSNIKMEIKVQMSNRKT